MKPYHTDFDLRVRVTTREGGPRPERTLARALKLLRRACGVACRDVARPGRLPAPVDRGEGR
jgi:hypothetical protein